MGFRPLAIAALASAVMAPPLAGQATRDEARLSLGVGLAYVGPSELWRVPDQPVPLTDPVDTFDLGRRIRPTIGIVFSGVYFPRPHVGFTLEGFLIGLGFEDRCRHAARSGLVSAAAACEDIQGAEKSATAVMLSGGVLGRLRPRALISPYARASAGLVFSNQSSIRLIARGRPDLLIPDLLVYDDQRESRVAPTVAVGAGFTAALSPTYQLRAEVRDNVVGVQRVTGRGTLSEVPPHDLTYKHLFSLTFGFDVVLERRRGRRY